MWTVSARDLCKLPPHTHRNLQDLAGCGFILQRQKGACFPPVYSPPLPGQDEPVSFSRLLSETRTQAQALNHSLTGLTPPHPPELTKTPPSPVSPSLLHLGITQALLFHHQPLTPVLNDQYQFPFPHYLRRKTPNKVKWEPIIHLLLQEPGTSFLLLILGLESNEVYKHF